MNSLSEENQLEVTIRCRRCGKESIFILTYSLKLIDSTESCSTSNQTSSSQQVELRCGHFLERPPFLKCEGPYNHRVSGRYFLVSTHHRPLRLVQQTHHHRRFHEGEDRGRVCRIRRGRSKLSSIPPWLRCKSTFLGVVSPLPSHSDVETRHGQITVFGIATSPEYALVVPFFDKSRQDKSYWNISEETEVRRIINSILSLPIRKIFQNGLYDLQYILREGYRINLASSDDTMILHHALYPELSKGLGFMGSIYTNESSWKILRERGDDLNKREE